MTAASAVAQNWLATVALLIWPLVAVWLFSTRPVNQATLWTVLGAYLLLPQGAIIKIADGIPQLDKSSIPALAALAGCLFFSRRSIRFWNGFGFAEVLLLMFLFGPLITSELNPDPVASGSVLLPGVGAYDGLSAGAAQFLIILPFLLGRQLLRGSADIEDILRTVVIAGLLYSLPILFEIRISPQLNYWLYGYFPSQFGQQVRFSGFRPMVFIGHGLGVAFFIMTATIAAMALWQTRTRVPLLKPAGVLSYLGVILVLCKGLAAVVYGAASLSLMRWTRPRLQLRIAAVIACIALLYPALRTADLVPTDYMVAAANFINEERAESLKFRFDHEQALFDKASQRLLLGWGRFGRNRLYDDWGNDISVSDGDWVVTLGQFGLLGFLAKFGLLALPIFRAVGALKYVEFRRDGIYLAALALIMAISLIDLIPNASLIPLTWLFAGALLGRAEGLRRNAGRWRSSDQLAAMRNGAEITAPQTNAVRT